MKCTLVCCSQVLCSVFVPPDTPGSVVYPVRVNGQGRQLHLNKQRFKRHIIIDNIPVDVTRDLHATNEEEPTISEQETGTGRDDEEDIYVRIENADEDLFLQLRPNRNLKTRGTVIEWVLPGGTTVLKTSPEDCFLVGSSVGEEGRSLVAVSSCSGLTGLIQTSKNSYFIEPVSYTEYSGGNRSNIKDGSYTDDFIKRYRLQTSRKKGEYLREFQRNEEGTSRTAYQHQRGYQEILSLPEPHVIYKVNTILERLNISLHEDQKFKLDDPPNMWNDLTRRKRSNLLNNDKIVHKKDSRKKINRKGHRRTLTDGESARKLRRRRRRHNRRLRKQCQLLDAEDTSILAEQTRQHCLKEEQRKLKRHEERQKKREAKAKKIKEREIRKQERERKKKERNAQKLKKQSGGEIMNNNGKIFFRFIYIFLSLSIPNFFYLVS